MDSQCLEVVTHLAEKDPGGIRGVYLYGSAVTSGLRPSSDVDMLVLTRRSMNSDERASLVDLLLRVSAGQGRSGSDGRPLEVTSVVIDDHRRRSFPPVHDFQFGEWLRTEIELGLELQPAEDPDVPILIATAQQAHRVLHGLPLADVVDPVAADELRDSMLGTLPDILEEIVGDERNTLLVLARILTTLQTGRIVPKDVAAAEVAPTLPPADRTLLDRARASYLGQVTDDWVGLEERTAALAHLMARRAQQIAAAW